MSKKPFFSVVIPLYNKALYIERAVKSVLAQTYPDFELLVVDDCSNDGGDKIVEQIEDQRIQLIRRGVNGGQSAARNTGVERTEGSIVAFLDADDEWHPGFLASVVSMFEAFPEAGLFATGYRIIYSPAYGVEVSVTEDSVEGDQSLLWDYFKRSQRYPFVWISATAIPRRIFEELGTFLEGEHIGGDSEMISRVALYYPIAYDRRILSIYHAEAQGRENPRRDRKLQSPPFSRTLRTAMEKGQLSEEILVEAKEYVNRLWLSYGGLVIRYRNRGELVRVLTEEIIDTEVFRRRVRLLKLASRVLPMELLYFVQRLTTSRWGTFGLRRQWTGNGVLLRARRFS